MFWVVCLVVLDSGRGFGYRKRVWGFSVYLVISAWRERVFTVGGVWRREGSCFRFWFD